MTATVRELLLGKQHKDLLTVGPQQTVQEALEIMAANRIGSLPVIDGRAIRGIVSERDYIRKVVPRRIPPWEVLVREIMTETVICVKPEETVKECMRLMTVNAIRHLPVVHDGVLEDMVSITDVLRVLAGTDRKLPI
jgi:CBS domain-containing protein